MARLHGCGVKKMPTMSDAPEQYCRLHVVDGLSTREAAREAGYAGPPPGWVHKLAKRVRLLSEDFAGCPEPDTLRKRIANFDERIARLQKHRDSDKLWLRAVEVTRAVVGQS